MSNLPPKKLRTVIRQMIGDNPPQGSIDTFYFAARDIARRQLASSKSRFRYRSEAGINSEEDLATDVIADLFERDSSNSFIRIRAYFVKALDLDKAEGEEVGIAMEKLVRQTVKDSLFRLYRSVDPAIARIIRNVKGQLRGVGPLEIVKENGTRQIAICGATMRVGQSVSISELCTKLAQVTASGYRLRDYLQRLEVILDNDSEFANRVPLTTFALAFRRLCGELHCVEGCGVVPTDELAQENDARAILNHAIRVAVKPLESSYLRKGRLCAHDFQAVQLGVQVKMEALICDNNPAVESNYDALTTVIPEMTRERFCSDYRNIFEYFSKLTRRNMEGIVLAQAW